MAKTYMVLPQATVEIRLERYARGIISADAYSLSGVQLRWARYPKRGTGMGVFGIGKTSTYALENLMNTLQNALDQNCLTGLEND